MTRSTVLQPSIDRETTVMAYSGGSPPALPLHITMCPRNHPITDPDTYFLSPAGKTKTCAICRMAWTKQFLSRQIDSAVQAERAARKTQQDADRLARRRERRAGLQLLKASRRHTRERRKGLAS
jgi:hypothetical protein